MAAIANTYTAFSAIGIREDLQNTIFNISPTDSDLVSSLKRGKANQHLHEWQTDSLAAATTANAQIEGDDVTTFGAVTPTTRIANRLQISRKAFLISDSLEETDRAGRGREEAYLTAKAGKELRRDMETILFANLASAAGSTSVARQMGTLGAWIRTNVDFGATGANPAAPNPTPAAARTDGTLRTFTTTILNAVISLAWTNGAEVDNFNLYVGPVNKQRASTFAGVVTKNYDISTPKPSAVIAAIDVYVSDFGIIKVKPNRWMRERDGYLLDKSMLSLAFLRPMKLKKLAKTGDAEKYMLITEWTLRVHNEAAHGLCADLITT